MTLGHTGEGKRTKSNDVHRTTLVPVRELIETVMPCGGRWLDEHAVDRMPPELPSAW